MAVGWNWVWDVMAVGNLYYFIRLKDNIFISYKVSR